MSHNVFDDLFSLKEASIKWKIDDSVLRRAIANKKFIVGKDAQKFGKQWVVTRDAMNKAYGQIDKINKNFEYSDNKKRQIYYYQSEILINYSTKYKKSLKRSSQIFENLNLFKMIYECYDYLHLGNTNDVVKDIARRIRKNIVYGKQ